MLTLQCWDEASGKLKNCELKERYLLLTFEGWEEPLGLFEVPSHFQKLLKNSIGKCINILRTDLENNHYYFNIVCVDTKEERIDRKNDIQSKKGNKQSRHISRKKDGIYHDNWRFITESQQSLETRCNQ
ncbi:Uncharacterised protein [uncultured archaeon]|nr:Uncharacterised protein [uncultured archaeon]